MDSREGLTDDPIGETWPKKKIIIVPVAFFVGGIVIFILLFVPGIRDFFHETGSIFSRSLSDTFFPPRLGKLVAEIDLQAERFAIAQHASSSDSAVSNSRGRTQGFNRSVLEKQISNLERTELKTEKNSEEVKSGDAIVFLPGSANIVSGSYSEGASETSSEAPLVKNILIAEVQIAGVSTTHDFIKIYNQGNSSVGLDGWKLRKKTVSGASYSSLRVFPAGSVIQSHGYFVWANSSNAFDAIAGANSSSTQTLAADNSIALFDPNGIIIDALAWGSGHASPYVEGIAYPINPGVNEILSRRFSGGALQDTNNNSADFEIK